MPIPANDYDIDPGLGGAAYRAEDNQRALALVTNNSDASVPPETFAFMWRVDLSRTPNVLQIRNPSNNGFLDIAEITDSIATLFSAGGGIPSLNVAQTFLQNQSIDILGSPGEMLTGSDLDNGIVARYKMRGHNASGSNVDGINLIARITDNTAGSEAFNFEVEILQPSGAVTVATLGSISDFRRSGGGGILDADIVRQAGITLEQIVREASSRLSRVTNFSANITSFTQTDDEGRVFRFNGSSNVTVTLPVLAQGTVIYFQNESSTNANITFAPDTGVEVRTSRLTLPGISGTTPMCAVHWFLSGGTRTNIIGDNV